MRRIEFVIFVMCLSAFTERVSNGQQIFWIDLHDFDYVGGAATIESAYTDGSHRTVHLNGLGEVTDIQVDIHNEKLYWVAVDFNGVVQSDMAGGAFPSTVFGAPQADWATTLDVHQSSNIAYFFCNCLFASGTCKLCQGDLESGELLEIGTLPWHSADARVDAAHEKVYRRQSPADVNLPEEIRVSNLDGSNDVVLHTAPGTGWTDRVWLASGKLYWEYHPSNGPTSIYRMSLDGTNVEVLASVMNARLLTLDPNTLELFWFNWVNGTYWLFRANADGSGITQTNISAEYPVSLFVIPKPPAVCTPTDKFADVIGPFHTEGTVQPDFSDIGAIVDCFRQGASCPADVRNLVDLHPCYPYPDQCLGNGGLIDFADVSRGVDAFRGLGCP